MHKIQEAKRALSAARRQVVGNGARRSRRFDVARSPALAEYSKFLRLLTPRRPEGRAPRSRQLADGLLYQLSAVRCRLSGCSPNWGEPIWPGAGAARRTCLGHSTQAIRLQHPTCGLVISAATTPSATGRYASAQVRAKTERLSSPIAPRTDKPRPSPQNNFATCPC